MTDTVDPTGSDVSDESTVTPVNAPPIESRFLFVDVAAMRAKQLRRGARVRLSDGDGPDPHRPTPHKAERVAMEEVRRGLVLYEVPSTDKPIPRD
jgi:DNA-directed RNA polymerase subunit K/omega